MNFFAHETAAARYAAGRPFFHPLVVAKIRERLRLSAPVPLGLDVACGTGQSAVALAEIAQQIVATDLSLEMLAQAPAHPRIEYLQAPAEQIPLPDGAADLLTVSLAFHWFDRARFLQEARRVLAPSGWLVIYSNGFSGKMKENPAFEDWNWDRYVARYPTPARHNAPFTDQDARAHGFDFAHREEYTNEVAFTVEQLADYLTTQSNVIAAVEQGTETLESVHAWITETAGPLFASSSGTFEFGGSVWYLQKLSSV